MPFQFQDQDHRPGLHYSCSVCQPQNMAAIPTFTGDGGPILSLTGEQRMEYALVGGGDNVDAFLVLSSSEQRLRGHKNFIAKHGDLVSTLSIGVGY